MQNEKKIGKGVVVESLDKRKFMPKLSEVS